jgi:DNA (cytosine-5)-methyltransferase 1
MLDLGLELAAESAGVGRVRPICYVEREAYAGANLVAKMEAGALASAPIWSDVHTLTGSEFRAFVGAAGGIDVLAGGIPCQPYSLAGKQLYSGDERDLLGRTLEIVEVFAPEWVALENVAGFVVPDGLGRLAEGLESLGYGVAAMLLSASDVGASHRRERVFILAHRSSNGREGCGLPARSGAERARAIEPDRGSPAVANANRKHDELTPSSGGRSAGSVAAVGSPAMGDPPGVRRQGCHSQDANQEGWMPDVSQRPGGLFAPARNADDEWRRVLRQRPDLAPSLPSFALDESHVKAPLESFVRRMADGMARAMVHRNHRLRLIGNGVVPLQAAVAYRLLFGVLGGGK